MKLPPYTDGCQDDPAKVDCDYPETTLKKIVSTSWVDEGGSAVDLVKAFQWTNDDQNVGGEVHLRGRHDARGRRREVDRREPGQGRRLARLSRTASATSRPGVDLPAGAG